MKRRVAMSGCGDLAGNRRYKKIVAQGSTCCTAELILRERPGLWVPQFGRTPTDSNRRYSRLKSALRGFTLIELMISAALMSLVLVSAYACLHAALASQKLIEPRVEVLQGARVALALITADLRCACPLSKDFDFLGTRRSSGNIDSDSIDFATHNYTPARASEGDFCEESVFLDKDAKSGQLGLWRRRNPRISTDPLSGGRREELVRGVRGLRFEYSDGLDWYESWGDTDRKAKQEFSLREHSNLSGLPAAVRITLLLDPNPRQKGVEGQETSTNEPPLVFRTVARLNLADANQTGPSSGSTTNAAPDTSAQPPPGQPAGIIQ